MLMFLYMEESTFKGFFLYNCYFIETIKALLHLIIWKKVFWID